MNTKHLVVIDWGQLGQSLQRISDKHNLRWVVDQRCADSVISEMEESQHGEIEVGDPGQKTTIDCFSLDGVTIIDL